MDDRQIRLIDAIVKGGVSVILSVGLLALFGVNSYMQIQQLDIMRTNMERQTKALEQIAKTYSGE